MTRPVASPDEEAQRLLAEFHKDFISRHGVRTGPTTALYLEELADGRVRISTGTPYPADRRTESVTMERHAAKALLGGMQRIFRDPAQLEGDASNG